MCMYPSNSLDNLVWSIFYSRREGWAARRVCGRLIDGWMQRVRLYLAWNFGNRIVVTRPTLRYIARNSVNNVAWDTDTIHPLSAAHRAMAACCSLELRITWYAVYAHNQKMVSQVNVAIPCLSHHARAAQRIASTAAVHRKGFL